MFQLFDEEKGRRYPLAGIIKEIGRTSDCDIILAEDEKVSRVHARLDWDGEGWVRATSSKSATPSCAICRFW